jgi:hypothetical protein
MTGDMKTHVYRTTDYGKTWQSLAGPDVRGYAHVIKEDLVNRELLFLGTELGLFVSVDAGKQWAQFTGKVPNVAVRDVAIHPRESDLILATHGRGVYIVDDITPLRKLTPDTRNRLESVADVFEKQRAAIVSTKQGEGISGEEKLREELLSLYGAVNFYEGRPTASQVERMGVLAKKLEAAAAEYKGACVKELPPVNVQIEKRKLKPVTPLTENGQARQRPS